MMRGLIVLAGLILTAVGLIVTFTTWTADGWTVLALVGVCLLGWDQAIEAREGP